MEMADKIVDFRPLLCSGNRDFFIRNNGEQVKVEDALGGKTIGVYFSAHWCGPCRHFTPALVEVYNLIRTQNGGFEVVFVSGDYEEDEFREYFSEMPWLAVPFSDKAAIDKLNGAFNVQAIPTLAVIDGSTGALMESDTVKLVKEYGVDAFPFSKAKLAELKEREKNTRMNQTVSSVLASSYRDFLLAPDGTQVRISDLEGKIVAIYFAVKNDEDCRELTSNLTKMYSELKQKGELFEIVLVCLDDVNEEDYKAVRKEMPWLALPFKDPSIEKLIRYFELRTTPTLVMLGADGKTLSNNLTEIVSEHGVRAYPFSSQKLEEIAEMEKKRMEEQSLESTLVFYELDYVLGKDGCKVQVKDLVGKTVLLYFSARFCPPCRDFTPVLVEVYNELKAKQCPLEIIFVSSDYEESSFNEYYSTMPWLTMPFNDKRKNFMTRKFGIACIPTLVTIDAAGRTVTTSTRTLLLKFGAKAFPFTEEHINKLKEEAGTEGMDKDRRAKEGKST